MTRVSAANGDACPEGRVQALSGEAAIRVALSWARWPIEALEDRHERFARTSVRRRLIPCAASFGVVFAIVGVVALTLQHLWLERNLALQAAVHEVDMRATLLAAQ